MRVALVEADAVDPHREQSLLIRSHHIFQVKREKCGFLIKFEHS